MNKLNASNAISWQSLVFLALVVMMPGVAHASSFVMQSGVVNADSFTPDSVKAFKQDLLEKLKGMKRTEMWKYGYSFGLEEQLLNEAVDAEDSAAAFFQLILGAPPAAETMPTNEQKEVEMVEMDGHGQTQRKRKGIMRRADKTNSNQDVKGSASEEIAADGGTTTEAPQFLIEDDGQAFVENTKVEKKKLMNREKKKKVYAEFTTPEPSLASLDESQDKLAEARSKIAELEKVNEELAHINHALNEEEENEEMDLVDFLEHHEKTDAVFLEGDKVRTELYTQAGTCNFGGSTDFTCPDGQHCEFGEVKDMDRWSIERMGRVQRVVTDDATFYQKLRRNKQEQTYFFTIIKSSCNGQSSNLLVRAFPDEPIKKVNEVRCSSDHLEETGESDDIGGEKLVIKEIFDMEAVGMRDDQGKVEVKSCMRMQAQSSGGKKFKDDFCKLSSNSMYSNNHAWTKIPKGTKIVTVATSVFYDALLGVHTDLAKVLADQGAGTCSFSFMESEEKLTDFTGSEAVLHQLSTNLKTSRDEQVHLDESLTGKCWAGSAWGFIAGGMVCVAFPAGCVGIIVKAATIAAVKSGAICGHMHLTTPRRRRRRRWR